jgi:toxin-antitoxin system PIN domain toxin
VRFAWVTLLAFLRIGTHSRVFAQPLSVAEATEIVDSWLVLPQVGILDPGERHWAILGQLLASAQARGNLVTDAHLAALALEHGATLVSTDRDFARFDGLQFMNPLDA